MGTIKCTDLCKNYRQKKVLDNVNLTIEEGKIYGLIGRNGAGKTTLLSIISAQNPASSGDVTLDGEQIWENEKALSDIFFSREFSANTMSGANNLKVKEYLKYAQCFLKNWDNDYANELLARFDLDKNQSINKLSKGMMSMVTIVVALASKAKFTFLDEPAAGLDVVARNDFYRLLIEEYTQSGRTFVISTHIIDEASDIFEEVIIVNNQKIALKENTAELLERAYHISGNKEDVDKMDEGLCMTFTTSCIGAAKVIGVKDIKVQQKMWYGWKTVLTSDGAESYDSAIFAADLKYADAIKDRTYRVICTHYADLDGYEEAVNDTGAFKFTY